MNTYARFLLVPAILAGVGFILHAQDADKERTKGTVLLLKTGHAMEGDIEKIGSQLCVRRGKSEVWIAEDKALRLCADWNDAYVFAQTQLKNNDAVDHLRLARWCHMHRLTDKALDHARFALELQPKNGDAKQLVVTLERALKEPPPKQAAPAPVAVVRPSETTPTVDVSFETLVAFTTKVQPILMNKCANCHASGAGGKLSLDRVSDNSQKAATQRNLAAVLTYVDLERPAISPLLVKAITPHGDAQMPPIRDRSDKPLQAMQQWIEQTIARNPQLRDYAAKKPTPHKTPQPEAKSVFPTQRSAAPVQGDDVVSQQVPRWEIDEKNRPRVQTDVRTAPVSTAPADPFDPLVFNRWAHPALYPQQSASR